MTRLEYCEAGEPSANDTFTSSSAIRPIPSTDVHRITSGQVVLDLQTAVKELIENALDASATNIAINFRDYGADSFEVIDNGTGIDPSNYASVALKHYTSKLSSFSDLALVRTFGFRGEALSSLCALAKVTIHTATSEQAPMGTVLQLDRSGRVESDTGRAARQRGTTITIERLFQSLPVRRKEFEKNLKREYAKAQNLLQAYALITKGVRWTTTNTLAGGRKTPQLSVNSSSASNFLSTNVSALFGAKVVPTLMPLSLELTFSVARARARHLQTSADVDGEEDEETVTSRDETSTVSVVGLISKPVYGSGRTSSDRQFFYINGRPWEAGRVSRAFNEVYKSFNSNHFPFVVADFRLPTDSYDVNVSPDKRTIFLHEESRLIEKVKEALEELFAPSRATFLVNGASHSLRNGNGVTSLSAQSKLGAFTTRTKNAPLAADDGPDEEGETESEIVEVGDTEREEETEASSEPEEEQSENDNGQDENLAMSRSSSPVAQTRDLEYREDSGSIPPPPRGRPEETMDSGNGSEPDIPAPSAPVLSSPNRTSLKHDLDEVLDTSRASWSPTKKQRMATSSPALTRALNSITSERSRREAKSVLASLRTFALPGTQIDDELPVSSRMAAGEAEEESTLTVVEPQTAEDSTEDDQESNSPACHIADADGVDEEQGQDNDEPILDKHVTSIVLDHNDSGCEQAIVFDMALLKTRARQRRTASERRSLKTTGEALSASEDERLLQGAGVNNQDEAQVERALSRVIHKQDFSAMEVVGQFNLGFIIARRRTSSDSSSKEMDDLFIVDQHASDEKFNFETLQLTTRIRSQKLISPRALELSASDELVAIEHSDTLLSNGFEISVAESGLPGTRVKLVAQPISKGTVFGVKDLEELLYLLRDTSAGSEAARGIRCSKASAMFASRACRRSIMIGTALNKAKMSAILRNMGTIEQPWNCPHGRPTMRHLACLKTLDSAVRTERRTEDADPDWNELLRCLP